MENVSLLIALIAIVFILAFIIVAFVMIYRAHRRLVLEKHYDDIVEENIALLYSEYTRKGDTELGFGNYVEKKEKARKRRSILGNVLSGIVAFFALAVIALSIGYRYLEGAVYLGDTAFLVVTSDSMSEKNESNDDLEWYDDQIPVGAFVTIEKVPSEAEMVPFAIYAYLDEEGDIVIHRFIEENEDGTYLFRGDKNPYPTEDDEKVERSKIVGRYTGYQNVPLGYAISFLKSPIGILVLASLFCIVIIQSVYSSRMDRLYDKRFEILIGRAKEIHAKYSRLDAERKMKKTLLRDIGHYPEGSTCHVLYGDGKLSTGERIVVEKEKDDEIEGRVLSDVSPYPSNTIRIKKDNLSPSRTKNR